MLEVGFVIRTLRKKKGWTLNDLSEQCKLSSGFLSQAERGLSSLSIASLYMICKALSMDISELFELANEHKSSSGKGIRRTLPVPRVLRLTEQELCPQISDGAMKYRILSREHPRRCLEALIGEFSPEYHYPVSSHDGEEFGYVLEGQLSVTIDGTTYKLSAGDCFQFQSSSPHCYGAGKKPAKVLWVQTLKYFRNVDELFHKPMRKTDVGG